VFSLIRLWHEIITFVSLILEEMLKHSSIVLNEKIRLKINHENVAY